jgi:hypothetical protein
MTMTKPTIVPAQPGWFAALAGEAGKNIPLCKQPIIAWAIWEERDGGRYHAEPITTNPDRNESWGAGFSYFFVDPYGRIHSEDPSVSSFDTEAEVNSWVAEMDRQVNTKAVDVEAELRADCLTDVMGLIEQGSPGGKILDAMKAGGLTKDDILREFDKRRNSTEQWLGAESLSKSKESVS